MPLRCRDDLTFRMLTAARPRKLREFQTCERCGQDYERRATVTVERFKEQRFCSNKCWLTWRQEHLRKHGKMAWMRTSDDNDDLDALMAQQATEIEWGNRAYPASELLGIDDWLE